MLCGYRPLASIVLTLCHVVTQLKAQVQLGAVLCRTALHRLVPRPTYLDNVLRFDWL